MRITVGPLGISITIGPLVVWAAMAGLSWFVVLTVGWGAFKLVRML